MNSDLGRPSEPALPQTEEGFRDFAESLIQNIDEVFFWRDPDTLKPYFVSQTYERIWGNACASAYAEPSSWIESIHPEDRTRVVRDFERAGSSGQTQVEYRIIRPDGDVRWIWIRMFPVRNDADQVRRIVGIAQDVTERKQVEKSRAFLASIVESSDDSIVGTDLENNILSWNHGAERLFGYSVDEALGKHIRLLFPPGPGADARTPVERIRQGISIEHFEAVRVAKGGTPIDVSVILSPIKNPLGELEGISAIYRDIRRRKLTDAQLLHAKEAAEAANLAKSQFLANMSHEIRTPMNGIIGMTEVLSGTELTGEQREYLDIVKQSADSLLAIVNDVLDFSKIDAQKVSLERQAFELRAMINSTIQELAILAGKKGLTLKADIRGDTPDVVHGDRGRLRQVLVNLIGNAIKFTDAGQVTVYVTPTPENGGLLYFQVRDTGIGIPPDKRAMIFDAFTQVDSSSTRAFGGTGLGLAISARLVDMMGGRIWVDSDGRTGSTFHFTARLQ